MFYISYMQFLYMEERADNKKPYGRTWHVINAEHVNMPKHVVA
jgi:hypothetical protein